MKRNIDWVSYPFDEIDLVYERVEGNEVLEKQMNQLENMALDNAEKCCGLFKKDNAPLTQEDFKSLESIGKEQIIAQLSQLGLANFNLDYNNAKIIIELSACISDVFGCTMFSILNRLEKLDGSFTVMCPKATLELIVPLGAKKGMMLWEMFIVQLFNWITVSEKSSNIIAKSIVATDSKNDDAQETVAQKDDAQKVKSTVMETQENKPKKKGLFSILFGK